MPTLRIQDLFNRAGSPAYPFRDDRGQLCWLESLHEEGGRLALKQQLGQQLGEQAGEQAGEQSVKQRVVTPVPYQIRSAVHEYGGRCFCMAGDYVYFNHYADGVIYRQHLHDTADKPQAISSARITKERKTKAAFADLIYSEALQAIIAIEECHVDAKKEPISRIMAFSLPAFEKAGAPIDGQVLCEGSDFYARPCVSDAGDQLAYLQWQHPNMPWDECALYSVAISLSAGAYVVGAPNKIAGGKQQSVCQAGFLQSGDVVFAMDGDAPSYGNQNKVLKQEWGFWNLYRFDGHKIHVMTHDKAEYGEAHWVFGQSRWQQIDDQHILVIRTQAGQDQLVQDQLLKINVLTTAQRNIGAPVARLSQLSFCKAQKAALCIAAYADKPSEIIEIKDAQVNPVKNEPRWINASEVSKPQARCFPTQDGEHAYANFYPARPVDDHADQQADDLASDAPPLLVLVHGGPSSRADGALSPLIQYFCQQGFAVLDINHRGSTGYGRAYRQKLLGLWGEIDASDIFDAIEGAIKSKAVDASKVFIRGGSAGGYAVLRALTRYPDVFRGGACYYGIGNLITLAEITHKFEGKYTDQLIGEHYDKKTAMLPNSRFKSRSPIFDIDKIRSPLILFQGLDDKVVPPEVSREMVVTLAKNKVVHEYIEYEGEGHGFRQARSRIDALSKEIEFYRAAMNNEQG